MKVINYYTGESREVPIKEIIEENMIKNPILKKAIDNNDTMTMNAYFKVVKSDYEQGMVLEENTGETIYLKSKMEKKKPKLTMTDFEEVVKPLSILGFNVDEVEYDEYFKRLKHFEKDDMRRKVEGIIRNETYKPKLSTFFKY